MQQFSVRAQPASGSTYSWQDGDRTLTVILQDDLTVGPDGKIRASRGAGADPRSNAQVSRAGDRLAVGVGTTAGLPVFRSNSGSLMTLPGGVMLALDETWSPAEVSAFFRRNSIALSRVSQLDYIPNGYFVATEPGFSSLNLANTLAEQEGVELSSPNWGVETTTR